MKLAPQHTKYRKSQKNQRKGRKQNRQRLCFGSFALISQSEARLSAAVLEAARRAMRRELKKTGELLLRLFPDCPVTQKPIESRMGKGKGSVDHWVARIQPGQILFEVASHDAKRATKALLLGSQKLPFRTHLREEK